MVTIKEIAQKAGVSVSTASIVLRGEADRRKISPVTAQKVIEAASALSYTANVSARRLRSSTRGNLVIAVYWATFLHNEFRAPLLQFLCGLQDGQEECKQRIEIVINQYERGRLAEALPNLQLYHAALISNATKEDMEALSKSRLSVPVVLHSREHESLPCVYPDNRMAGEIAAEVFASLGLKHALLVAAELSFYGADICERSFIQRTVERGLTVQRIEAPHTMRSGYETARKIADMQVRPDAVFFLSDVLALGALKGFAQIGIRVPQAIRVISMGSYDQDIEEYATPSLSVIQAPLKEMGKDCLLKAIGMISGNEQSRGKTRLPVSYIARESCEERKE